MSKDAKLPFVETSQTDNRITAVEGSNTVKFIIAEGARTQIMDVPKDLITKCASYFSPTHIDNNEVLKLKEEIESYEQPKETPSNPKD